MLAGLKTKGTSCNIEPSARGTQTWHYRMLLFHDLPAYVPVFDGFERYNVHLMSNSAFFLVRHFNTRLPRSQPLDRIWRMCLEFEEWPCLVCIVHICHTIKVFKIIIILIMF